MSKPKTVLVTGASRGLGAELAVAFAGQGRRTVLTARNGGRLAEVARRVRQKGGINPLVVEADLAGPSGAEKIHRVIADCGLTLDIVVNNAALQLRKPLAVCEDRDYERVFDTNVKSVFFLYRSLRLLMNEETFMVNIASQLGQAARKRGYGLYSASKAALINLGGSLALEDPRLCVLTFCPGALDTETYRRLSPEGGSRSAIPPADCAAQIALRVAGTPFTNTHHLIDGKTA
jgi:NAD(P)-dependent dehydrogenase (short-subunit alcohol dehydrogenase family)